jgi:hypothetical protein
LADQFNRPNFYNPVTVIGTKSTTLDHYGYATNGRLLDWNRKRGLLDTGKHDACPDCFAELTTRNHDSDTP